LFPDPKVAKEDDLKLNKKLADTDPNETRTIQEIVESAGFKFEAYSVTTEDGYILEMHRIYSPWDDVSLNKPAVLL